MCVHGNNLPGQDMSAYDADVLVFEQETVVVGRGGQSVERVQPRPARTRSARQRLWFRRGHRHARIAPRQAGARRCTMFEAVIVWSNYYSKAFRACPNYPTLLCTSKLLRNAFSA